MIISNKLRRIELLMYLFVPMLLITFVYFYPLVIIIKDSLILTGTKNINFSFINYITIFQTDAFISGIKNNFLLLISVPIIIVLAILFAAILYDKIFAWKFYRFIVFMAYILPIPVVGIVFVYIFQLNGVFNTVLRFIGLGVLTRDWFGDPKIVIWSIMSIIIWKMLGFNTVLLLARMMNINLDLYDAAKIDGCNWFQQHLHISIPQCSSTLRFLITIDIIVMFAWVFNYVYVTTTGGPNAASMVTELMIYKFAFTWFNFKMAATAAFILFLISSIFIIIQTRLRVRAMD